MSWISCENALPRPYKEVLVAYRGSVYAGHLFLSGLGLHGGVICQIPIWDVYGVESPGKIAHWMFPPAPPTQEN